LLKLDDGVEVKRQLFFDKGFEASQRLVPFGGDAVEIIAKRVDGLGIELEEGVASGPDAADNSGTLQNAKVLGDGLAREMRAMGELRDGAGTAVAEFA
jgi:hypothetical protein